MRWLNRIKKIELAIAKEEKKDRLTLGYFMFRVTGERAINFIQNWKIGPIPITKEQKSQLFSGVSPYKILLTKEQDTYLRTPKEKK